MINISSACVIGGAGFLGSHVVHKLVAQGVDVSVMDDLSIGKLAWLPNKCKLHSVDISHPEVSIAYLAKRFDRVDCVFNYAAKPFIPDSFQNPIDFVNTNTVGAFKVLEACRLAGVKRFLQVSSAEVYGNSISFSSSVRKLNELSPLAPPSTYASTKTAIDSLCVAGFLERDIPVIILRQFNCVGERETHPYVIPEIIQQLHKSNEIYLGANTARDFLYAGDAADMAIELIAMGEPGEVYNMGSQSSIQIYDLARLIGSIMRPNEEIEIVTDSTRFRPCDILHLCSDNSKLFSTITTRPKVTLTAALEKTIRYFQEQGNTWGW